MKEFKLCSTCPHRTVSEGGCIPDGKVPVVIFNVTKDEALSEEIPPDIEVLALCEQQFLMQTQGNLCNQVPVKEAIESTMKDGTHRKCQGYLRDLDRLQHDPPFPRTPEIINVNQKVAIRLSTGKTASNPASNPAHKEQANL